ncbi:MAG TPA: 30S ribosomal protein S6 [Planctomycetaceae bacterium]|nr:30S ribosomal protein S6 [Planctomycetaceae bacterium]
MPATSTAAATAAETEHLYEGMFLLDSGKFAADAEGLSAQLVALLEKAGGEVTAHRPWQDGRLAYEIEGHRKGLHYVAMFKMHGDRIGDLARACKLSNLVIRHMVIRQEPIVYEAMLNALSSGPVEEEPPPPAEAERPRRSRPRAEESEEDE